MGADLCLPFFSTGSSSSSTGNASGLTSASAAKRRLSLEDDKKEREIMDMDIDMDYRKGELMELPYINLLISYYLRQEFDDEPVYWESGINVIVAEYAKFVTCYQFTREISSMAITPDEFKLSEDMLTCTKLTDQTVHHIAIDPPLYSGHIYMIRFKLNYANGVTVKIGVNDGSDTGI